MERVYNFAAGPSTLALPVLERAQKEMLCYGSTGMSVMEMTHRSKMYTDIYDAAVAELKTLMAIPDNYEVIFMQGGATLQFSGVPLNMMVKGVADYVDSGNFAHLAAEEAKRYGQVNVIASSREDNYTYIPEVKNFTEGADYVYITTNNTIYGTRYTAIPKCASPLVADMSSNILSEVYNMNDFGVVFAGAQKNIGPSGLCIMIIRKDLLGNAMPACPKLMDWKVEVEKGSMYNTPNTWGIYMAKLTFDWLIENGGVAEMEKRNIEKAKLLYDCIDNSKLFKNTVKPEFRSRMNVTFVTGDKDKDEAFVKAATAAGLMNIKGHRAVGGMRASIYNAMPIEGVKALVDFMQKYEAQAK
ncbi:MAG: 3-phosphoserine/phosphohydroxythreonine transaminase [Eubacteriales bacterium]|nr:3-phosphoserine/phosphohydroxythreonine transaminase [Eubacteriales bacterium]MDD3881234.1 3-phosphoserine/phosphohydroxythreonine transaminase [Eubacteriales bacterium]MDD4512152.1 3-phosphoserine/phosphohydroxythreonine transaminase [Eubacteriales bacterium]